MNIRKSGLRFPLLLLLFCQTTERAFSDTLATGSADRQKQSALVASSFERYTPVSGQTGVLPSPNWNRETVDTARGADYLTEKERELIIEINMLRTDPAMYTRHYLIPLRAYYEGNLLKYPGKIAMTTNEGDLALEECIRELETTKPISPLSPQKGLVQAARDHIKDQGVTGEIGHTGSDGSSLESRLNRYGKWNNSAGENISYGYDEARKIVVSLLIDDGVPSRGHRKNLLNKSFNFVGVDVGPHRLYKNMAVMEFAGAYISQ